MYVITIDPKHNKTLIKKWIPVYPRSGSTPHQINLQYPLLTCTAYTTITKHKQIGWANIINI